MTKHKSVMWVFDHDPTSLLTQCQSIGFLKVPADGDEQVATFLANDDWRLAFLHIDDVPWQTVCGNLGPRQAAVRFSKAVLGPFKQSNRGQLAMHCTKMISELADRDLENLKTACLSSTSFDHLIEDRIPAEIQGLVAFMKPFHLVALNILLQRFAQPIRTTPFQSGVVFPQLLGMDSTQLAKEIERELGSSLDVRVGNAIAGLSAVEGNQPLAPGVVSTGLDASNHLL
ncbi:MAG TPA: hypothetical protein VJM08_12630 [Anaerolineales bacterium]|nr:hypothetical protein [Anaerolineales bacterium]